MKNFCLISAALLLSACGSGDTSTVTVDDGKGGKTKITASENGDQSQMTMTDGNGQTMTASTSAGKANFPAFAPQYPGATIGATSDIEMEGKRMLTIEQITTDAPDKVVAFYKDSLEKNGVKVTMSAMAEGTGSIVAGDETGPSAMINATPEDGKTKIGLVLNNIPK